MNIVTKGERTSPKCIIYGMSGSGKSTIAATLPDVLFLDIEGGLSFIDGVARNATKYTKLVDFCRDLMELVKTSAEPNFPYKYVVIDTVDWLSRLVVQQVAGNLGGKTLMDLFKDQENTVNKAGGGYGQGYQMIENHVRNIILPALTKLNDNGVGIILLAHAEVKNVLEPDGTTLERVTPKIDQRTMNVYVEWADNLLYLMKEDSGDRKLILESTDSILAKNRIGLTGEVSLSSPGFSLHKLITGHLATGAETK